MFSYIKDINSASEPLKTKAVDSRLGDKSKDDRSYRSRAKRLRDLEYNGHPEPELKSYSDSGQQFYAEKEGFDRREGSNRFSVDALIFFLEDLLSEYLRRNAYGRVSSDQAKNFAKNSMVKPKRNDSFEASPWLKVKHSNVNEASYSPALRVAGEDSGNRFSMRHAAFAYARQAAGVSHEMGSSPRVNKFYRQSDDISSQGFVAMRNDAGDIYDLIGVLYDLKRDGVTHLDVVDNAPMFEAVFSAVRAQLPQE
ncbi:MAG: hypothetical protein ACLFP8_03640 [Alphaproteobacteria bacterium]